MPRRTQGGLSNYKNPADPRDEPDNQGIGRSRGGLTTKTHALVDGCGLPLVLLIGPGQAGDSPMLPALLASLRVPRQRPGRPRNRPDALLRRMAYSARAHRATCVAVGSPPSSPNGPTKSGTAATAGPPADDP